MNDKDREILSKIKDVIAQLDEGAITEEECYNYIVNQVVNAFRVKQ